ncbi:hypothetical protein TIFTF001_022916 [Ficus carica]|uniref:Uncharacterized protein n=1 Tax=Ficus carica TaxID=3494 RepID=A0AA88AKV6_FICCA|nr:hypothetical protein TIFTF001_022916 [Ficus carica]
MAIVVLEAYDSQQCNQDKTAKLNNEARPPVPMIGNPKRFKPNDAEMGVADRRDEEVADEDGQPRRTQTTTLNSGAKVTDNLLSRMRELEITVNSEPCEEVEEVTHPFTVEVMTIPIPDKFKLPTMPLYDGMTDPDDHQ